MSVYTTVSADRTRRLADALRAGRSARVRADRRRHRKHQLLRHRRQRSIRPDALRAAAGGRAAVLPQSDGASGARRRTGTRAGTRSQRSAVELSQRQARRAGDATRRRAGRAARRLRIAPPPAKHWRACTARSRTTAARLTNRRGPGWWRQAARAVRPFLSLEQNALLAAEIKFQTGFAKMKLPRGAIHGDLFLRQRAVRSRQASPASSTSDSPRPTRWPTISPSRSTIGATVAEAQSRRRARRRSRRCDGSALTRASARRTTEERAAWPVLLRAAALRFWLSRLYDLHLPRPGELTHAHDPTRVRAHTACARRRDAALS